MNASSAAIPADGRRAHITLMLLEEPDGLEYRRWSEIHMQLDGADHDLPNAETMRDGAGIAHHVVWRLNSANWRRLAWSAQDFTTTAEAHQHARRVIERVEDLELELVVRSGALGWRLRLDGEGVMVSARWYSTPRQGRAAADRTVEILRRGVGAVLLPPPYDPARGTWAFGISRRVWFEQLKREMDSQVVDDVAPHEHRAEGTP